MHKYRINSTKTKKISFLKRFNIINLERILLDFTFAPCYGQSKMSVPNFHDKALESMKTSECMIQNNHYNGCCHSAYYACIQEIKHILEFNYNIDETKQENLRRRANQKTNSVSNHPIGSHQFIINLMTEYLEEQIDMDFERKIKMLQQYRITADYQRYNITYNGGRSSIALANDIIELLNKK